jgi:hypothetical protein
MSSVIIGLICQIASIREQMMVLCPLPRSFETDHRAAFKNYSAYE